MKQTIDRMRDDLSAAKTQLTATDQAASQSTAQVNDLTATNEKLQAQIKDLGTQLASLHTDNDRLTAGTKDAEAVRTQLNDLKTKLAESEKTSDSTNATVAELTGANDKLTTEKVALEKQITDANSQINSLRADSERLAQAEQARADAEKRADGLATASAQLLTAQRDINALRSENARLSETVQALDRDRTQRITQLQQENAAITARLRQAQGTLDQIAAAARIINSTGLAPATSATPTRVVTAAPEPAARTHTVAEGDSLTRISVLYYGTANRWQDIYDANRDVLKGENALRPGQKLKIPQ
jgi:nucleoid-associated protein YgaU